MPGTLIYTRENLITRAQAIGPDQMNLINESHIRGSCTPFLEADRVELHIDGWVAVLKDRYGTENGSVTFKQVEIK